MARVLVLGLLRGGRGISPLLTYHSLRFGYDVPHLRPAKCGRTKMGEGQVLAE